MTAQLDPEPITERTRALCRSVLDQPAFQTMRASVDAFLADETARTLYQSVSEKGTLLQQQQQMGMPVDAGAIAEFEKEREALLDNPLAQAFLTAQQAMHEVQQSVQQYLSKTFELGRMPEEGDLEEGECGHGCGCH